MSFRNSRYISLFFFACCLLVMGGSPRALAGDREKSLETLVAAVQGISSIRTNFTQTTDIPMFSQPLKVQGILLYARPAALLWEYQEPFVEGFSLKDGRIVRWENSRASVVGKGAGQDPVAAIIADNLMAWVSLDLEKIRREYDVKVTGTAPVTLHLVPKNKGLQEIIADLTISFQANGVASSVVLREARGGSTTISFYNTVINAGINPAEFLQ